MARTKKAGEAKNDTAALPQYQWEICATKDTPEKDIQDWQAAFGPRVVERDATGVATRVRFTVLADQCDYEIYLVGDCNNWSTDPAELTNYQLQRDGTGTFASLETEELAHGDRYKFLLVLDGATWFIQDPAGVYFDDAGNTIVWDYADPSCYRLQHDFIDTRFRSTKIIQTDLPGLVAHFADRDGRLGREIPERSLYTFITESGVIPHLQELGFNTIQFLPFAQSIDGPNWKFRYLVPYQFAIQKNWGSPDEFARMIDTFHAHDIAVIGDFVIGHMPFRDYNIFGYSGADNGLQIWKKRDGRGLYLEEETSWGTMRPDIENPYVRDFLTASILHFMKAYRIDGMRIDNVDGILRYGDTGEGEERPSGRRFLRELNQTIYQYNPWALIHFEAHYFYEDNAKMLVVPFAEDPRALGATAYNESRSTYYLHTTYMPMSIEQVSVWKFRDIIEEKEWGQSSSTVADFHNHDAAAGLMEMRATGSYAYDTMTVTQPHNHIHALGKIKVMEALVAFLHEGRTLDLVQTFLLQTGTFEHNSAIEWQLTFVEVSRNTLAYKRAINLIMDAPAFWPLYVSGRSFLNVDEQNKILVIERYATRDGVEHRYVIVINLSSFRHLSYKVGVRTTHPYRVVLNSDAFCYAGFGMASYPEVLDNHPSDNFGLLDREVELPLVAPYGVVVLQEASTHA